MPKGSFNNQTIVITGVCGGLGTALCHEFGKSGAKIAGVDINEEGLADLDREIGHSNIQFRGYHCDITKTNQTTDTVAAIKSDFDSIHALVNNAGISHLSAFAQTDLKVIQKVMDVNFFGAVHMTKACLPELLKNKGHIVTISSVAGFAPLIHRTGYAASKHALEGFFNSLRTEIEPQGVKVMLVSPAFIQTQIAKSMLSGDGSKTIPARIVTGKKLTCEEVACTIHAGMKSHKRQLYPGRTSSLSYWVHHLFPTIYETTMVRKLCDEFH